MWRGDSRIVGFPGFVVPVPPFATGGVSGPPGSVLDTLRRSVDFARVRKGVREAGRLVIVNAACRSGVAAAGARFGFILTRAVGNAVTRNRIRRRLREIVRVRSATLTRPGTDYVLIARGNARGATFAQMLEETSELMVRANARLMRRARRRR